MALTFEPKSEEQIEKQEQERAEKRVAPAGEYDFQILNAENKTSKSGNAMIEIEVGLFRGDTMAWKVKDWLLPAMESKLRHFCDAAGLLARYESGMLTAEDCRGRSGRCRVAVEPGQGNYPDKNAIKDYRTGGLAQV